MNVKFSLLLISLIAMLLTVPVLGPMREGAAGEALLLLVILAGSAFSICGHRAGRAAILVLAGAAVLTDVLTILVPAPHLAPWGRMATASFLGLIILMLVDHVLKRDRVSFDVIVGGVCTYLLIAALFANLYALMELRAPGSILIGGERVGSISPEDLVSGNVFEFLYYSLVSLTTLGYGDMLPITPLARITAGLEAMIGQLYPAILIAHLVGLRLAQVPLSAPSFLAGSPQSSEPTRPHTVGSATTLQTPRGCSFLPADSIGRTIARSLSSRRPAPRREPERPSCGPRRFNSTNASSMRQRYSRTSIESPTPGRLPAQK